MNSSAHSLASCDRFQILSLDGGGIKGVFSAAVLAHIEDDLSINITDHFDLIAGTSTGGIIALGLAKGMRPREILEFYERFGPAIFSGRLIDKIWAGSRWLFRTKYRTAGLQTALQDCFGDHLLSSCSLRVIIPAYNLADDNLYIFKTAHHPKLRRDYKLPIWKIAMATAAAPTYFAAYRGVDHTRLIDGGIWANNPSILAISEAVSMLNVSLANIHLLSLGTTLEVKERSRLLDKGGLLTWARPATEVFLQAQTISSVAYALHLLGESKVMRLNPTVPAGVLKLDKLRTHELMAIASTTSRNAAQLFADRFLIHIAQKPTFYS